MVTTKLVFLELSFHCATVHESKLALAVQLPLFKLSFVRVTVLEDQHSCTVPDLAFFEFSLQSATVRVSKLALAVP